MASPGFDDRRLSFGAAAADYAAHRPTYPVEAVRWALGAASRTVREVADVGAGTGAFSGVLAALGLDVTAFEPDAITAAQAWHWFDKPAAAAEFVRVVRPGGVIGLFWNVRDDRVPWMDALSDIVEGEDSMRATRSDALAEIAAVHPGVERGDFPHTAAMSPEAVVGLVSTFSYVRLRTDADDVYAAVRTLLATHPDTAGRDVVEVPYLCAAYRVRR